MNRSFWNEYKLHIDLYKFYFSIALKANAFFYAVAGAIIFAYYSSRLEGHPGNFPRPLLLIPIVLSITLAVIFFLGAFLWKKMCDRIAEELDKEEKLKKAEEQEVNDEEGKTIRIRPRLDFLWWLLIVFACIFLFAGGLLLCLMGRSYPAPAVRSTAAESKPLDRSPEQKPTGSPR